MSCSADAGAMQVRCFAGAGWMQMRCCADAGVMQVRCFAGAGWMTGSPAECLHHEVGWPAGRPCRRRGRCRRLGRLAIWEGLPHQADWPATSLPDVGHAGRLLLGSPAA